MKFLLSLVALLAMASQFDCQPLNDAHFNSYNYLAEVFNPIWRHHRARLRPFAGQLGAPIVNIRGARSIKENELTPKAECIFSYESIYCVGMDKNGEEKNVECDATSNLKNTELSKLSRFSLSDLRILETGEKKQIAKLYMFAMNPSNMTWMDYRQLDSTTQNREIISLHSAADNLEDKGFSVLSAHCWDNMVSFFKSMKHLEEIRVQKEFLPSLKMWEEKVKVIANLIVV